jgi:hypothetical protein
MRVSRLSLTNRAQWNSTLINTASTLSVTLQQLTISTRSRDPQPRLRTSGRADNSLLHYAAEPGSYCVAEYIVLLFPDVPFYNQSNLAPGHFAATIGDLSILKILSKSHRVIESTSFTAWNPLHYTIHHCVTFLTNRFPNLLNNVTNEYEFSVSGDLQYLSLRWT